MADLPDLATATAHEHWDARWRDPGGRAGWLVPDPDVVAMVPLLHERKAVRALDLGCGLGRHALMLAEAGLETYAVDASEAGLAELRRAAEARGLRIAIERAAMTELPYRPALFDYVLAFNVVYHGDASVVRAALDQVRRVLRLGGLFQATFLAKTNASFGRGREIAPDTWIAQDDSDKDHPHVYCDEAGLRAIMAGFDLRELRLREHAEPGSWHWHLLAEQVG